MLGKLYSKASGQGMGELNQDLLDNLYLVFRSSADYIFVVQNLMVVCSRTTKELIDLFT